MTAALQTKKITVTTEPTELSKLVGAPEVIGGTAQNLKSVSIKSADDVMLFIGNVPDNLYPFTERDFHLLDETFFLSAASETTAYVLYSER